MFSSIEFCLWDAQDDATNFQRNFSTGEVEVDDGVIYHKTEYRERRDHFAYFACSRAAGRLRHRSARRSSARTAAGTGRSPSSAAQSVGLDRARLAAASARTTSSSTLAPGETREVIFVLGYAENPRDDKFDPPGSQTLNKRHVKPVIERWLRPGHCRRGLRRAARRAGTTCSARSRWTPPTPDTNRMVNIWNAYQCMVTFNMSRSASFYESGIGRGMGFRDSNQDLLGFVHMIPERARERILDIAATQLPTGGAYHQYQPLTKRGNNDIGSGFNDDPLWLVLGVAAYLKETGDWSILDEPVPYDNEPGSEVPLLRASAALRPVHPGPARTARPAADRAGRLERLPEPQLLLRHAG